MFSVKLRCITFAVLTLSCFSLACSDIDPEGPQPARGQARGLRGTDGPTSVLDPADPGDPGQDEVNPCNFMYVPFCNVQSILMLDGGGTDYVRDELGWYTFQVAINDLINRPIPGVVVTIGFPPEGGMPTGVAAAQPARLIAHRIAAALTIKCLFICNLHV